LALTFFTGLASHKKYEYKNFKMINEVKMTIIKVVLTDHAYSQNDDEAPDILLI
jgi:hypothetical protein